MVHCNSGGPALHSLDCRELVVDHRRLGGILEEFLTGFTVCWSAIWRLVLCSCSSRWNGIVMVARRTRTHMALGDMAPVDVAVRASRRCGQMSPPSPEGGFKTPHPRSGERGYSRP